MAIELEEFHQEFLQEVYGSADADGQYAEDAFFDIFCAHLIDAGELDSADRAHYLAPRGLRVDGYGGDPLASGGVLSLIIADYSQSTEIATLTASDMDAIFKRASNFVTKCFDSSFRESLEETGPAFGLSDLIAKRWPNTEKVRLFLISNRQLSARVDGRAAGEINGVPLTYSVWDLGRLYRFATSSHGREDIHIDLEKEFGGPMPALPAHLDEAGYEAFLVVVPGRQIAEIYDRWGARLLEQNVRVFLQVRGNVNKGIRNTIENDPEMFFAYNNGITATAESIQTRISDGRLLLTGFKNFQIVNGGQTTASIHAASRKTDIDLSKVFVQMKLSIIEPSRTEEVVPKISEYANSQNRVSAADFFSNHPFHIRMAEFSRRMFAPSPDGTFRESKWFYERARGQYQDARSKLTPAQIRKFDLEYPKPQVFSKTDLAKFLNSWDGHPNTVSKGAQKNFAHFAQAIGKEWLKQPDAFNEMFFRHAISKAIIFREVEKLVTEQPWYQGGYRANVVAYAIAKFAADVARGDGGFDFDSIWRKQGISTSLKEGLTIVAEAAHTVITDPAPGISNVTEWAKTEACWSRVAALKIPWPDQLLDSMRTVENKRDIQRSAIKEQKMLNGIEAQIAVVNAGGVIWRTIKEWGAAKRLLTQTEAEILDVASSMPGRMPSEKQSIVLIETLKKLHKEGCQLGLDIA
ncbi:MAG: AIPR family protein [Armatimonadota bacterium]|nr:AIPR family protein [Armatimonadota bacterium]